MCIRIWKRGLSGFGRATKQWIRCCKKWEELGYYKAKCCKTATRARRAAGGDFSELRGILRNRGQERGEGGGESESGCICALRVVHYTESRSNEVEAFHSRPSGEWNAAERTRAAGMVSGSLAMRPRQTTGGPGGACG